MYLILYHGSCLCDPTQFQVITENPDTAAQSWVSDRCQHLRGTLAILNQAKAETAGRLSDAIELFNTTDHDLDYIGTTGHGDIHDDEDYMAAQSESDCSSSSSDSNSDTEEYT